MWGLGAAPLLLSILLGLLLGMFAWGVVRIQTNGKANTWSDTDDSLLLGLLLLAALAFGAFLTYALLRFVP